MKFRRDDGRNSMLFRYVMGKSWPPSLLNYCNGLSRILLTPSLPPKPLRSYWMVPLYLQDFWKESCSQLFRRNAFWITRITLALRWRPWVKSFDTMPLSFAWSMRSSKTRIWMNLKSISPKSSLHSSRPFTKRMNFPRFFSILE